jgi:hypothetical protein
MYNRQNVDAWTIRNFIEQKFKDFIEQKFKDSSPYPSCSLSFKLVRIDPDETGLNWTVEDDAGILTDAAHGDLTLEAQEIVKEKANEIVAEAFSRYNLEDE